MADLSKSPLVRKLRVVEGQNPSEAWPSDSDMRMMTNLELVDGRWHLTDLGRATLAALSLPDPGEPLSFKWFPLERCVKWIGDGWEVHLWEWASPSRWEVHYHLTDKHVVDEWPEVTDHECDDVSDNLVRFGLCIRAAHALLAQWRQEREG